MSTCALLKPQDFLRKCLTYDAHSRPNATELYEHPFICKSMPREKWEVLHPSNFMTIELAKSSMREVRPFSTGVMNRGAGHGLVAGVAAAVLGPFASFALSLSTTRCLGCAVSL